MTSRVRLRRESLNGMSFVRRGSGRPVVLLHGWSLSRRMWTHEEALLSESYSVVTPDLAGFGHSDDLPGPFVIDRYADDVVELLREEGLDGAIVVGFAFGAAVAMAAARKDDSHIGGMVLAAVPSGMHLPNSAWVPNMHRDWPAFGLSSAKAICVQPQSEASLCWIASMFWQTPLTVAIQTWHEMGEFDPLVFAADLRVPTLYLHGAEDRYTPASVAEECARAGANGEVVVFPDCGHLVSFDCREQFGEQLLAFAKGLE